MATLIPVNKNLVPAKGTSWAGLEPRVYAVHVEAVLAFRQLPVPFTVIDVVETDSADGIAGVGVTAAEGLSTEAAAVVPLVENEAEVEEEGE